MGKHQ